jgi:hypothetical protein
MDFNIYKFMISPHVFKFNNSAHFFLSLSIKKVRHFSFLSFSNQFLLLVLHLLCCEFFYPIENVTKFVIFLKSTDLFIISVRCKQIIFKLHLSH